MSTPLATPQKGFGRFRMRYLALAILGLTVISVLVLGGVLVLILFAPHQTSVGDLKTGRKIQIISMEIRHFTSGEEAFYLSYLADEPLNDIDRMNGEEDEVWKTYEGEADRCHMTAAIIAPSAVKNHLFIGDYYSYNYVYKKRDGVWFLTNKPASEGAQQSNKFLLSEAVQSKP